MNEIQKAQENSEEEGTMGDMFKKFAELARMIGEFITAFKTNNFDKLGAIAMGMKLENAISKNSEFEMTYKEGEKPSEKDVYSIMKGKEVIVNN